MEIWRISLGPTNQGSYNWFTRPTLEHKLDNSYNSHDNNKFIWKGQSLDDSHESRPMLQM